MKQAFLLLFLAGFIFVPQSAHASIRKQEGAVNKNQTEAISLKQKLEETKDGPKGAPSPSMTFYGNSRFLAHSPVAAEKKGDSAADEINGLGEEIGQPEDTTEGEDASNMTELEEPPVTEEEPASGADDDSWWSEDGEEDAQSK